MKPLISLVCVALTSSHLAVSLAAEKQATSADHSAIVSPAHHWQLLLFTIPGCSACITMRHQVIEPMIATGHIHPLQFSEVVQVSDADWHYVRGVGYDQIRNLKVKYKTSLFPTLVAIDMNGNKLAENMVGVTSVEHYRAKLEALIAQLEKNPR
jgi:thioredoxin-related protein